MNYNLTPVSISTLYPPPGLGCRDPPPGFRYRHVQLPYPSRELQAPVYLTPSSKPKVTASSPPTIQSALFPRPLYSSALRSRPFTSVSITRPISVASITDSENFSLFSQPDNLPGVIRRPSPAQLPSTSRSPQPPSHTSAASPPVQQAVAPSCHFFVQPIYVWHCCCGASMSQTTDHNNDGNRREHVAQQRSSVLNPEPLQSATSHSTNTNEIPEVSILSFFEDSPVRRPNRPSIHQNELSNDCQIPKRKRRRGPRNRQVHQEQHIPPGAIRPGLPIDAFFVPIRSRDSTSAPSTTRENNRSVQLIRPIPIRPIPIRPQPEHPIQPLPKRTETLTPQHTQSQSFYTSQSRMN